MPARVGDVMQLYRLGLATLCSYAGQGWRRYVVMRLCSCAGEGPDDVWLCWSLCRGDTMIPGVGTPTRHGVVLLGVLALAG